MSVKVLVVDDSKVERNYLAGLLERLGVTPDTADSCEDSAFKACKQEYDLILIDYFMPDSDGVHALKEIRTTKDSLNVSTPAIALGLADPVLGDDFFMMQGFVNYLEKPVDHELLHAALLLYLPEMKRSEVGVSDSEAGAGASVIPEWLRGIEELNIKDGVKNCGTEEGFMSALGIFLGSIDNMSHEIQSYYNSENWTDYTIKVHALKSSARIIGLAGLSELAKQLEAAGDSGDLEFIHSETGHLLTWYGSYKEKFAKLSGGEEEEKEKPPAEQDFLEDAFSSLEEFAGQMDYDMVEMVIGSLEEYSLEPEDQEIFDAVNAAFMTLDWNALRTAAHRYIEKLYGDGAVDEEDSG